MKQLFSVFLLLNALWAQAAEKTPALEPQLCQWQPLAQVLQSRYARTFSKHLQEHERNLQRFVNGYYQQIGRDLINRAGDTPHLDSLHVLLGTDHRCDLLFARVLMRTENSYQFADTLWLLRLDADKQADMEKP